MAERITENHKFNAERMTIQDKIKRNQTTSIQWFRKSNGILLFSAQNAI